MKQPKSFGFSATGEYVEKFYLTTVAATPPLFPTTQTPTSLAWDELCNHSGGTAQGLFLLLGNSRALMVGL